jgi:hypothetical protein
MMGRALPVGSSLAAPPFIFDEDTAALNPLVHVLPPPRGYYVTLLPM